MTKQEFIDQIVELLKSDPHSTQHDYDYMVDNLPDYLDDLIATDGSITSGLLAAIETHLSK